MRLSASGFTAFISRSAITAFAAPLTARALANSNADRAAALIDQLAPKREGEDRVGGWHRGEEWKRSFFEHLRVAPESARALAPRVIERVATAEGLLFAFGAACGVLAHCRQEQDERGWVDFFDRALAATSRRWSALATQARASLGEGESFDISERLEEAWGDPSRQARLDTPQLALGLVVEGLAMQAIARDWTFLSPGGREAIKASLSAADPLFLETLRHVLAHCVIQTHSARLSLDSWLEGFLATRRDAEAFESALSEDGGALFAKSRQPASRL